MIQNFVNLYDPQFIQSFSTTMLDVFFLAQNFKV